jgi:hypothetical protein
VGQQLIPTIAIALSLGANLSNCPHSDICQILELGRSVTPATKAAKIRRYSTIEHTFKSGGKEKRKKRGQKKKKKAKVRR